VRKSTRPAIFKWRQTAPELIVCAVRWYLRYSLSPRDVEELLDERSLKADHTTVWRWVQRYGPERSLQAEEQTYAIQISERYLAPTIEAPFRAEIAKIRNAGR
jgi:transposase-like protein